MNEGKLRLEAMRKMLKKNNHSNGLLEKAKTYHQNTQIQNNQVRNQLNHEKQSTSQQNEKPIHAINEQCSDNSLVNQQSLPVKEKEQQELNKEEKGLWEQQIREEGEVEEDEQVQLDAEGQRQQKNETYSDKRQSEDSSNQNGEVPVDEIHEQKPADAQIQQSIQVQDDHLIDQELVQQKQHDHLQQENPKSQDPYLNLLDYFIPPNQNLTSNNSLIIKQRVSNPPNTSQNPEICNINLTETQSLDQPQSKPHRQSETNSISFATSTNPIAKSPLQPSKPAIKVVLKQLQMIKSSIHNLAVSYRGVQFLRQQMKKDSQLKKRIKQRLEEYGRNGDCEVLRKMMKKSCAAQNMQNVRQSNFEAIQVKKPKRINTIVNQGESEGTVHQSRDNLQPQEEGSMVRQMIEA